MQAPFTAVIDMWCGHDMDTLPSTQTIEVCHYYLDFGNANVSFGVSQSTYLRTTGRISIHLLMSQALTQMVKLIQQNQGH